MPSATRLGNLDGIVYNGQLLKEYGLYSDNCYLTGGIKNLNGKWELGRDGSGQVADNHIKWDENGNLEIKIGDKTLDQHILNISADQFYSSITGYVTKDELEQGYVSKSEIVQTANEIKLNIYDEINQKTGIDIESGHITIDANTTTFTGNITLQNPDDGITIFDKNGKPKIVIKNSELPKDGLDSLYSKRTLDTSNYKLWPGESWHRLTTAEMNAGIANSKMGGNNRLVLGTFTTSEKFTIDFHYTLRYTDWETNNGVYDIPDERVGTVYSCTLSVYANGAYVKSETFEPEQYRNHTMEITCDRNAEYTLAFTCNYMPDITYLKLHNMWWVSENMYVNITTSSNGLTFIGTNGMYIA